ncbi:MAG: trypsin-like peptidase domain-containing protein [Chloroflexi bacterium]|nr:trypsin-like peptidase domain-containing protein [Chloroflexota bacterium]
MMWLITANHVVQNAKGHEIAPLVSVKGGGVAVVRIGEIQTKYNYQWHADVANDVAATLMPSSPDWTIKAIGENACIRKSELVPSMACFTVGCPYGVMGFDPERATPLVLDGIISGLDPRTGHIFTSTPTFPGNSGGPIIVRRDPFSPGGGLHVGSPVLLLAGIILRVVEVPSPPDPSSPVSLPPLRLGEGVSIETALDLVRSPSARGDRERVLPK